MTSPATTDPAASMAFLRDLMRDDAAQEYADAAARRGTPDRPHDAPSLRRPTWSFLITLVLVAAVLSVGLVQRRVDEPQALAVRQALVERVAVAEQRVAEHEADIARERAELAALQAALLADSVEGEALGARIDVLSAVTGYTAVVGPGAVVVLDDAKGVDRTDPAAPGRVQDRDVALAVNGLWQAGAEAIAVNGRRLTATTAIRTAGAAILVDFRPLVPPYRVEAIGDPGRLSEAYAGTRSAQTLATLAEEYGLRLSTSPAESLSLPAATAILPVRARVPAVPDGGAAASTAATPTSSQLPSSTSTGGTP